MKRQISRQVDYILLPREAYSSSHVSRVCVSSVEIGMSDDYIQSFQSSCHTPTGLVHVLINSQSTLQL